MSGRKPPASGRPIVSVASWLKGSFSKPLLLFDTWIGACKAHEKYPKPENISAHYSGIDVTDMSPIDAAVRQANERQGFGFTNGEGG